MLAQHLNSNPWQYAANMQQRQEITTKRVIARNLDALMKRRNMSQNALSKVSGVSQRHISSILREEAEPGAEKLSKLAKAFGLEGWQLQIPNLPGDLLDSDQILKTVKALADSTPEGRDLIVKNAVREAHFSKRQ